MVLRERMAPLVGDSARSIKEDNLFANGVALQRDYHRVSVTFRPRDRCEEELELCPVGVTYRCFALDACRPPPRCRHG